MNQLAKEFMGGMDRVDALLEKIPGKTGVKLGAAVGVLVMTSPLAASLALGSAGAYGVYKLAKCVQESQTGVIDAEVAAPDENDK